MAVLLYLHLQKFRVAFYTIGLKTIVIYDLKIHETLIASGYLHSSIGSKHMAPNWTLLSLKIQAKCSMEVSLYPHLEEFRDAFHTIDLETIMIYTLKIHEMLISSGFLCNSIGSIHMVQNGNPFSPKIQL